MEKFPRNKLKKLKNINYAVMCGSISNGLIIIDWDFKKGKNIYYDEIYNKFKKVHPKLSDTYIVKTPNGYHFYYYLAKGTHPRTLNQDTSKDTLIKSLLKGRNPYLYKATKFPELLKGVDILGEKGYAIIPPSEVPDGKYKAHNNKKIKKISKKQLDSIKDFFLLDKKIKNRMRDPFYQILNGKIDIEDLCGETGKDEFVYWKYTYLEAYHSLELDPEDIIPFLQKGQSAYDEKTTYQQLPHINLEDEPLTNEKMVLYFPTFKPTTKKTRKRLEDEPIYLTIAHNLLDKYDIKTLEDTGQMLIKTGNLYLPNLSNFKRQMAEDIAYYGKSIVHISNNIEKYIKYTTQFSREDFCYDHGLINFHNGYYDLHTDKFYPNDKYKDKLFCYEIPHEYDPNYKVDCPKFKKLLDEWLSEDDMVKPDDIFEMIGYTMTMNTDMNVAFFIYGPTHTGKTQFQTILEHVVGHQNRKDVPLQRMGKNEFGSEGLEFTILNMVGDMSDLSPKDVSLFKTFTGNDKYIRAEWKGGKKYLIRNILKIWYNGNRFPVLERDDDAFYGRWLPSYFGHVFPMFGKDNIKNIGEKLCQDGEEIKGIIHEAIKGLKRLYKRNYFRAELIMNSKHVWKYEADPLYAFLHDNCTFGEEEAIVCLDFKKKFNKFLYDKSLKSVSSQKLKDMLEKYGIYKERHGTPPDRDFFYMGVKWKVDLMKEWNQNYIA